jgi:hypothetical protein
MALFYSTRLSGDALINTPGTGPEKPETATRKVDGHYQ